MEAYQLQLVFSMVLLVLDLRQKSLLNLPRQRASLTQGRFQGEISLSYVGW